MAEQGGLALGMGASKIIDAQSDQWNIICKFMLRFSELVLKRLKT